MVLRSFLVPRHRKLRGFSLVEVAVSLGIVSFAMISILGLLPAGLISFRQAVNTTVESEIVQALTNELQLSNFNNLSPATYFYDAEGNVTTSAQAVYTAQVTLQAVQGPTNFPITLINPVDNSNEAYKVGIQIIGKTPASKSQTYSIIIANKNI